MSSNPEKGACKAGKSRGTERCPREPGCKAACASPTKRPVLAATKKSVLSFKGRSEHCANPLEEPRRAPLCRRCGETWQRIEKIRNASLSRNRHQQLLTPSWSHLSKQLIPLAVRRIDPVLAMHRTPSLYSPPTGGCSEIWISSPPIRSCGVGGCGSLVEVPPPARNTVWCSRAGG